MNKPCYHCHEREAALYSVFCGECLPQESASPVPPTESAAGHLLRCIVCLALGFITAYLLLWISL